MPIKKYYQGHGSEVMSDMKKRYGDKKGESVFYATANARKQNPEDKHGSLHDIEFHEEAATSDFIQVPFYAEDGQTDHKATEGLGTDWGDIQCSRNAAGHGRDMGHKIPVDYFGPDTDYRAEELDVHQYGKDYDPIPYRDYFKTEDKMAERTFRVMEQDEYDETPQPGMVTDEQPMSEAYGAVNFQKNGPNDVDGTKAGTRDHRSFESQRHFARTNKDKSQEYAVDVGGLDTKKGDDIR